MTPVNKEPLEVVKRRIRLVEEVVADPDTLALILQMVSSGKATPSEPSKTKAKSPPQKRAFTARGDLKAAILKVLPQFTGAFSSRELIANVEAAGYTYTAKDKGIATSSAIKRLIKGKILQRADSSKNRKDFKYKRVSV